MGNLEILRFDVVKEIPANVENKQTCVAWLCKQFIVEENDGKHLLL